MYCPEENQNSDGTSARTFIADLIYSQKKFGEHKVAAPIIVHNNLASAAQISKTFSIISLWMYLIANEKKNTLKPKSPACVGLMIFLYLLWPFYEYHHYTYRKCLIPHEFLATQV